MNEDFDIELFVNFTEGYPVGSLKNAINQVLSE